VYFLVSSMKKLMRGKDEDSQVAGVCAGLADYFDTDVAAVRIIACILLFSSFGVLPYLICWLAIPPYSAPTDNSK
jgi:phage shock protein C